MVREEKPLYKKCTVYLGIPVWGGVAWMVRSNLSYSDILDFRRVKALAKMFCGIKSVPKRLFDRTGRGQSDLAMPK